MQEILANVQALWECHLMMLSGACQMCTSMMCC